MTVWIPCDDVRPGDGVRLPTHSGSDAQWRTRKDAERSNESWRTVERTIVGLADPDVVSIMTTDGGCHYGPREAWALALAGLRSPRGLADVVRSTRYGSAACPWRVG